MDLITLIHELRMGKARCEEAIALLEQLQRGPRTPRRGRKNMGTDERQAVSTRMKNYWAGRRASAVGQRQAAGRGASDPVE